MESILRPNTIASGTDLFAQEANSFIEIIPSAVKQRATLQAEGENSSEHNTEDTPGSLGVSLALVHTTSKLDLETRWLVQWEGERIHPILVTYPHQSVALL